MPDNQADNQANSQQLPEGSQATESPSHIWEKKIDLGDGSGVQVFRANSAEELVEKLAQAQANATKKIRELNRRLKLGEEPQLEPDKKVKFNPRRLSDDEAWRVGNEIADPAKAAQAVKSVIEAEFGAPIEAVREAVLRAAEDARQIRAKEEAEAFIASQPEYYPCPENLQVMTRFLEANNLACTKKNLDFAFDELNAAGLLKHKPVEAQTAKPQEGQGEPSSLPAEGTRIDAEANTRPRRAATGLRSSDASSTATGLPKQGPSPMEIASMSAAEYAAKFLVPQMARRR